MRRCSLLALLAVLIPAVCQAQILRPRQSYSVPQQAFSQVCPGPGCEVIVSPQAGCVAVPSIVQLSTPEGIEEVSTAVADGPNTRALVSGSCGSGTIQGADASGAYVLSNAHVWGTQIGKTVSIDIVANGRTVRLQGRIIWAAYSNRTMVDAALAKFEGLTSKRYMPMLKTEPVGQPYATTGSPRCVWPLVTKPFNDPRNYGQGLITGMPDAIGGQSGSAIYNSTGQQIALLTWSINGRCAGQKTSKLWEVASQRNVMLADPRPIGLQEISGGDPAGRPVCEEGVFGELPQCMLEKSDYDGSTDGVTIVGPRHRPETENVIASVSNTDIADLPIWYTPGGGGGPVDPPVDPDCPDCPQVCPPDHHKLSPNEWALIEFLRAQQAEQSLFGDLLKGIDWVKLAKQIIEIIKLFQSELGTSEVAFGDFLKSIDWVNLAKVVIQIIKIFSTMEAPGPNDLGHWESCATQCYVMAA